jgi:hypothetical protein
LRFARVETVAKQGEPESAEGRDPCEGAADHERMDIRGSLVRDRRLKVVHVTNHWVLKSDAVCDEHLARTPRERKRRVNIRELAHADLFMVQTLLVLEPTKV